MAEKVEWIKEYHTPTVGTVYHITIEGEKSHSKPKTSRTS